MVVVGVRVATNAAAPLNTAPPAVAATVPQLPCALNCSIEFELDADANTAVPYTVAEPINVAAATVDAVVAAATPLPTIQTAHAAAAKPPQVTTVATAQAATTAAPSAQCHQASPVGSILLTELLPQ